MELKRVSKYKKETVEEAAKRAFEQIEKLRYEEELGRRGVSDIVKLAVVFDGKKLWVKESK